MAQGLSHKPISVVSVREVSVYSCAATRRLPTFDSAVLLTVPGAELKKQLRKRTMKLHTADMQKALLQVLIDDPNVHFRGLCTDA